MKLQKLFTILLIVAVGFVTAHTTEAAKIAVDQPCVEVSICDVDAPVVSDFNQVTNYAYDNPLVIEKANFEVLEVMPMHDPGVLHSKCPDEKPINGRGFSPENRQTKACAPDIIKLSLKEYTKPRVNYAGFGAFISMDGDGVTDDPGDDPGETNQGKLSIIEWVTINSTLLFGLALAISEVLALIPGIKQNGIFQTILTFLRKKNKKQTTSS